MNAVDNEESLIFRNPDNKPLEDLKLIVQINGISQKIPALDKYWIESKCFLNYETPVFVDSNGRDIIGAKEQWCELINFILNDFKWLLHLPFYKFWSNIIYNTCIMESIISFLQEAPTFYTLEKYFNSDDLKEFFSTIRKYILLVFARLVTNKESNTEYMSLSEHAHLLYNNYIFTIPILMDLCQQYGRDNKKIVEKIVNSVFTLQPLYKEDLRKAALFIIEALRKIERRFEDCPVNQEGQAVPLSDRGGAKIQISLPNLEDLIIYLLDTVSTINVFLDIYAPSVECFKVEDFITKLISIYSNTIPEMYKRLDNLACEDETIPKYIDLKNALDITRIEILSIYRATVYKQIKNVTEAETITSPSEISAIVEDFLFNLMHTLSEKEFVIDYHNIYPVTDDFQTLLQLHPDLDTVKCEFIVNSIFTFLDDPILPSKLNSPIRKTTTSEFDEVQNNDALQIKNGSNASETMIDPKVKSIYLISEIKDVLCHLGEGMIQKCLKYYNNDKEAVINAVLEDSLPSELKNLDPTLPYIPSDSEEMSATADAAIGVERLNVYDNDEFDIMTKDVMDTSRIHKGKRKDKYKDLNELLNVKSHIAESKNIYDKYSLISNEYDDEYDDTYDDNHIGSNTQDDFVEVDTRPFTIPRVLQKSKINNEAEEEIEIALESDVQTNKDNFIEDPALLREKAEEARLRKKGTKSFKMQVRNVESQIGQGQQKDVLDNRKDKNKHKATRANHNRRAGSQWKRNHGMLPS